MTQSYPKPYDNNSSNDSVKLKPKLSVFMNDNADTFLAMKGLHCNRVKST